MPHQTSTTDRYYRPELDACDFLRSGACLYSTAWVTFRSTRRRIRGSLSLSTVGAFGVPVFFLLSAFPDYGTVYEGACANRADTYPGILCTPRASDLAALFLCFSTDLYFLLWFQLEHYCSRSTFAGSMFRARLTGPATERDPVSSKVNATAASTNGSCAVAW